MVAARRLDQEESSRRALSPDRELGRRPSRPHANRSEPLRSRAGLATCPTPPRRGRASSRTARIWRPVELRARRSPSAPASTAWCAAGPASRRSADELFTLEHDADGGVYVTRTSDIRVYLNGAAGAGAERGADDINLGLARGARVRDVRPGERAAPGGGRRAGRADPLVSVPCAAVAARTRLKDEYIGFTLVRAAAAAPAVPPPRASQVEIDLDSTRRTSRPPRPPPPGRSVPARRRGGADAEARRAARPPPAAAPAAPPPRRPPRRAAPAAAPAAAAPRRAGEAARRAARDPGQVGKAGRRRVPPEGERRLEENLGAR